MLAVLLAALQTAASANVASASAAVDVQARVQKTFLYVSLDVPEFREDAEMGTAHAQQFGDRALIHGRSGEAALSVITEADQPHRPSAQWRDAYASGTKFELGEVACQRLEVPDATGVTIHYSAYPVAAGQVFDLHASQWVKKGEADPLRERFEGFVKSFRVQYVRRGMPQDLPKGVRDAMDRALRAWPEWRKALGTEIERAPDEFELAFVLGQLSHFAKLPTADLVATNERAAKLFEKLETPAREQKVAGAIALETFGLSRAILGNVEESLEPLTKALKLATETHHAAQSGISYNLACSYARLGRADEALKLLGDAIRGEPLYRARARTDPDFAKIAADPRFAELVRQD